MHSTWASYINEKVTGANAVVNEVEAGDQSITVDAAHLKATCEALKNGEHEFNVLQVVSGVDYPEEQIIEVNYILASFTKNTELILKVRLPRGDENNLPKVDSVVSVWKAADFQERETYDMLGVEFVGHPDHRRILCPEDWTGFPLRKDYVVQEKYLDMVVNPVHKMNIGEREFGVKHAHIKGASTSVKNYEVEAPATAEDTSLN
jgi:NADH-quinone oxidoreductase subunit C